MRKLSDILKGSEYTQHTLVSLAEVELRSLVTDSRRVGKGDLFVALGGTRHAGVQFSAEALAKGAVGVVFHEKDFDSLTPLIEQHIGKCFVSVRAPEEALGVLANNYYGYPSQRLKVVGITGTNGKTTTASLLHRLLLKAGKACGLVSTVGYFIKDTLYESATHTTPDTFTMHRLLAKMVDSGCSHAAIEVSSHALSQGRVAGVEFSGGILTNVTHDHLDYHGNFLNYLRVKKSFFDLLPASAFALVNADDANGLLMLQNCVALCKRSYALGRVADYQARLLHEDESGLQLRVEQKEVLCRLKGAFNAYNLLAAFASGDLLELDAEESLQALSNMEAVEGRFEWITNTCGIHVVIDFAHTPDALRQVMSALSRLVSQSSTHQPSVQPRLLAVLGCGGGKDKTKRPKMGQIATSYAAQSFFTSDNPRNEAPERIIADMQLDLGAEALSRVEVVIDRKQAIARAIEISHEGDFVLIAGKGHEAYQEIKDERFPFSDKEVLRDFLKKKEEVLAEKPKVG